MCVRTHTQVIARAWCTTSVDELYVHAYLYVSLHRNHRTRNNRVFRRTDTSHANHVRVALFLLVTDFQSDRYCY